MSHKVLFMSVFKHKNGYYGYNFMYKGKRYCRTFKGLNSDEVAKLETVHKAELIKTGYDITKKQVYNLSELIVDYKEYRKAHYTRPDEFDYVIDEFYKLVGNKDVEQITVSDLEKYINSRLGKHYRNPVPPEPIRALWGCREDFQANEVILVASSGITQSGADFISNKPNFRVFNLDDIIKMAKLTQTK